MNRRTSRSPSALLQRRARALQRHLGAAVAGESRGIHQARVASRRVRETVPVLGAGTKSRPADKVRKRMEALTRALGRVRELDVTLALLDDLLRRDGMPRAALEDVRAHVLGARQQRRSELLRGVRELNTAKLGRALQSFADAIEAGNDSEWREELAKRLLRRARRLRTAIDAAGRIYAADHLHAVRLATKKLRYALELAADSGTAAAAPLVRTLKRTQDTLGRLHDLQVLQMHLAAVEAEPPTRHSLPGGPLSTVSATLEEECRHLHAEYVAAIPALRDVCQRARDVVSVELTAKAAAGRRRRPAAVARPAKRRSAALARAAGE